MHQLSSLERNFDVKDRRSLLGGNNGFFMIIKMFSPRVGVGQRGQRIALLTGGIFWPFQDTHEQLY